MDNEPNEAGAGGKVENPNFIDSKFKILTFDKPDAK